MNGREHAMVGVEPWEISRALLENVYYAVTAVVSLDENGRIMSVQLFDTVGCDVCVREEAGCAEVWLMSQHPEGREKLYEEDERRAAYLRARLRGGRVRVFVTGEDLGCVEIGAPKPEASQTEETEGKTDARIGEE